jgi:hypothetical protein
MFHETRKWRGEEEAVMEMNLLSLGDWSEAGTWLTALVGYLAAGAGALVVGGVAAVLYEVRQLWRQGPGHCEATEVMGYGVAKR